MTIHRTNIFKSIGLGLVVAVAGVAQPAMSEEHGVTVGSHHFVYYRDHDIYFAPERKTYYWMNNGTWQSGPALPADSVGYIKSGGVEIDLDTDVPYTKHEYVVAHYKTGGPAQSTTTERSIAPDGSTTTTTTTTTKRHYVYYGDHDIYFAPETKTYYWQSNGTWQSGVTLPAEDRTFVQKGGVTIELDTDRPYTQHDYVIAHYKNKHDRDDRRDNDR